MLAHGREDTPLTPQLVATRSRVGSGRLLPHSPFDHRQTRSGPRSEAQQEWRIRRAARQWNKTSVEPALPEATAVSARRSWFEFSLIRTREIPVPFWLAGILARRIVVG